MPTFPTYDGELPSRLNPLNFRHYWLLAYWIFFRPTALKCYLYQSDRVLYRTEGGVENLIKSFRNPAYVSLYIQSIGLAFLLGLLFGFPVSFLFDSLIVIFNDQRLNLDPFLNGKASQNLYNGIFDVIQSPLKFSAWIDWMSQLLLAISQGVAWGFFPVLIVGLIVGHFFGVSFGTTYFVPLIVAFGIIKGLSEGMSIGIFWGLNWSFAIGLTVSLVFRFRWALIVAILLGLIFGLTWSVSLSLIISDGRPLGWTGSLKWIFWGSIFGGFFGGLGSSRLILYLVEFFCTLLVKLNPRSMHEFNVNCLDELGVLPLVSEKGLTRELYVYEKNKLHVIIPFLGNTFRGKIVRLGVLNYLRQAPDPLSVIYSWMESSLLDSYVRIPLIRREWLTIVSRRQVLFGKLSGLSINEEGSVSSSNLIYRLTRSRRKLQKTPLTQFIALLYLLLYETETNPIPHLQSQSWQTGLDYPDSQEIIESFQILARYLIPNSLQEIADFSQHQGWQNHPTQSFIRPTVIAAISNLDILSLDIRYAITGSRRTNQLAILARANDSLQTLHHYVTTQVPPGYPEQKLLHRIIDQWRNIITTAAGSLGQTQLLEPIPNPYIVGNPVSGQLFVGRDDILARIEELWRPTGQLPSIILYGHRRMGKTSILQNLTGHLGPHTRIIDFNMQRVGMVRSDGELLHNLALALYDTLPDSTEFPEPTEPTFTQQNPYAAFDRFLKQLTPHRNQTRYIIALDEFELLEQRILEGRLDRELLTYLRSLINTYPWFILALAGLHSLQEMTHDYWSPLFGNVTAIPVSFLSRNAATNLITNPTDDFPIDYDPDAIAEIYSLTGGQPYLIQLICHNLISRYNHQRFEDNIDIEPRFSLTDVQTIIDSPTFFSQGHAYFSGIWSQASEQHGPTQHAILRALSQSQSPEVELLQDVQLLDHYTEALELLERHDIIHNVDDRHQFVVPLMQLWVAQYANPD
jgi:hypothetical protein